VSAPSTTSSSQGRFVCPSRLPSRTPSSGPCRIADPFVPRWTPSNHKLVPDVLLDELDVETHFVKESTVLSKESRSSEKLVHGINVLMAKNYIDNLSEETRKGMTETAEQGSYQPGARSATET
jgi:hypothetical protein